MPSLDEPSDAEIVAKLVIGVCAARHVDVVLVSRNQRHDIRTVLPLTMVPLLSP